MGSTASGIRVIISDTCCVIDLHKVNLWIALIKLPNYKIVIPDTLYHEELLGISLAQREQWLAAGLTVMELDGQQVSHAVSVNQANPKLSINDCFAFTLAKDIPQSILLTGDKDLRNYASSMRIEIHGALWALDELKTSNIITDTQMLFALQLFEQDPTVRLPPQELKSRIRKCLQD